ncbi:MAG TPA: YaiI/YqxD family protein [Candidatus Polarisedimenticolia bacterium]|nr:YaiI/YqxD family protein [Candidatus Polarisedimenticolia bacterium]
MLQLFVDADGCPVKQEVYRVARRFGLRVKVVTNASLSMPPDERVELVVVGRGLDAADDWIAGQAAPDDIVITADIPLASRCLKKGARVLGTTGRPFTDDNIGEALATRELMSHLRDLGNATGGPAPFDERDRSRFLHGLDQMIQEIRRRRPEAADGRR